MKTATIVNHMPRSNAAAFSLGSALREAFAEHYAKESGGERWITLNGGDGDGTHVKVDGSGKITGGPDALAGKSLGKIDKNKKPGSNGAPKAKGKKAAPPLPNRDEVEKATGKKKSAAPAPAAPADPDAKTPGTVAYLGGFSAVHTGNMVAAAGRKYHEVRMTEGPDIGKTKVIPQEKDLQADAEAKRKQWQEQQAAFSRLDASQAKPQPTPPAAANPTPSAPANDEPAFSLSNPKPKPKPMEFENLGGKQGALFGKSGLAGQMNLFADKGVPDSMVAKPQAQPSAERDRGDFSQVKPPEPKPSLTPEQEKVAAGKGGIPKPSGETAKSVAAKHDAEIEHLKALTALAKVGIDARKLDRGQAVDMAKRLAAGQGGGEPEAKPPEPKQGKPKAKKPGKVRDRGEEDAKSDAEEAAYNKQQRQATEADRAAGVPAPGPIPSHELPQHFAKAFANHGQLTGPGGANYGPNNANNRALMQSDADEFAALKAAQQRR